MRETLIGRGWVETTQGHFRFNNALVAGIPDYWQLVIHDKFVDFYHDDQLLAILDEIEKESK